MSKKNIITGQKISPEKQERARELRRKMTPAKRRLWERLRGNRLGGWHFRRQQIIDGFIVDFGQKPKAKSMDPSINSRKSKILNGRRLCHSAG